MEAKPLRWMRSFEAIISNVMENPYEASLMIQETNPDSVLLDLIMLEEIMIIH